MAVKVVRRPKQTFWEKLYIPQIVWGLKITFRHFFKNLFLHIAHRLGRLKHRREGTMPSIATREDGTMEPVVLTRDVDAVEIPAGHALLLKKGTDAFITQSLGGTYTVQVRAYGGLFRIDGKDADAIGKEVTSSPAAPTEGGGDIEHQVWEQLKTCYDPEIPVNIVDLGLVYDVRITSESDGASRVEVNMTLTAQGCGMGGAIAGDARQKLLMLPGVSAADVQIVWDPPWNPQMISPEGKKHMGMA